MNIAVYTAIFGPIGDQLQTLTLDLPDRKEHYVTFQAFTDGVTKPTPDKTGWALMPAVWGHKDPRRLARRHKLLSHILYPEADVTIWVDGCLTPLMDPVEMVRVYLDHSDICVFSHMQRDCLYEEAKACIKHRKDNPTVLNNLVHRYRTEGYPEKRGLGETTCVMRRHTDDVKKFNEAWWAELYANSIRDQMSFDYLIWKMGMSYNTFQGSRCDCPHFMWIPHR